MDSCLSKCIFVWVTIRNSSEIQISLLISLSKLPTLILPMQLLDKTVIWTFWSYLLLALETDLFISQPLTIGLSIINIGEVFFFSFLYIWGKSKSRTLTCFVLFFIENSLIFLLKQTCFSFDLTVQWKESSYSQIMFYLFCFFIALLWWCDILMW